MSFTLGKKWRTPPRTRSAEECATKNYSRDKLLNTSFRSISTGKKSPGV